MTSLEKALLTLAITLLDSDDGISQEAYDQLATVFEKSGCLSLWQRIAKCTDATDGRWYASTCALDDLYEMLPS
jgi:hypothetical protein